jgi:hypothetical protein
VLLCAYGKGVCSYVPTDRVCVVMCLRTGCVLQGGSRLSCVRKRIYIYIYIYIKFNFNSYDSGVLFLKLGLCLKDTDQLGVTLESICMEFAHYSNGLYKVKLHKLHLFPSFMFKGYELFLLCGLSWRTCTHIFVQTVVVMSKELGRWTESTHICSLKHCVTPTAGN